MDILYISLGVIAVLCAVYLVLIAPVKNERINAYRSVLYAHRGLHGEGVAEKRLNCTKSSSKFCKKRQLTVF